MWSIPDGWDARHAAAYEAWRDGDADRLNAACALEIARAVRAAFGRHPVLSKIQGAREELRARAETGIQKAANRYDPARGVPFQAYARQDVYWETQRGAKALTDCVATMPEGAGDDRSEELEAALRRRLQEWSIEKWRGTIAGLDIEPLAELCGALDRHRGRLIDAGGKGRFALVRGFAGAYLTLRRMGEHGYTDVSGPISAQIIKGLHRSYNGPAMFVSWRNLGPMLGVSDKTAKKYYESWEKDPPAEGEDLFDYLRRIAGPRGRAARKPE